MSLPLCHLFGGTFKRCLFNNLLLRIVACTHIQIYIPTHHVPLPCLILTSLVSLTPCLSVVASYHGHVIGTSLRKWKLVITSVSYALWWIVAGHTFLKSETDLLAWQQATSACISSLMGGYTQFTSPMQLCLTERIEQWLPSSINSLCLNRNLLHLESKVT